MLLKRITGLFSLLTESIWWLSRHQAYTSYRIKSFNHLKMLLLKTNKNKLIR